MRGQAAADTGKVLVVDDEPELRRSLKRILTKAGHTVIEAASGAEALRALLAQSPIDVVLLDLNLPDGNGLEILSTVRASGSSVGVVVLTASNANADMRDALTRGAAGFLRKPVDPLTLEAQVSVALSRVRSATVSTGSSTDEPDAAQSPGGVSALLEQLPFNLADQLSHAWDLRHVETGAHVRRMAESARCLALALRSSASEASRLGRVAMLHDIGKIAIPDAILTKPGKLADDEFAIMKRHAEIGGKFLSGSNHPFLELAATVARSHHERWNGKGYPDGLVGKACPWEARVVGVVDVYDALGQARCYKDAWPRERLLDYFHRERGRSFDPEIVDGLFSVWTELEVVKSEHPDPIVDDNVGPARLEVERAP